MKNDFDSVRIVNIAAAGTLAKLLETNGIKCGVAEYPNQILRTTYAVIGIQHENDEKCNELMKKFKQTIMELPQNSKSREVMGMEVEAKVIESIKEAYAKENENMGRTALI